MSTQYKPKYEYVPLSKELMEYHRQGIKNLSDFSERSRKEAIEYLRKQEEQRKKEWNAANS